MKQKSHVAMRMEFLEYGDRLGFPKMPYLPGKRVNAGEDAWTTFAKKAPLGYLAPALRGAKIRADYLGETVPVEVDDKRQRVLDNLAKARAARAAKRAEGVA